MYFRDRTDAAQRLAAALDATYRGRHPLVLAIPRGAVPMGRVIADALGGELDVALVRKLRAPGQPEFAVGAIDETGWAYIADCAAVPAPTTATSRARRRRSSRRCGAGARATRRHGRRSTPRAAP